MLELLCCYAVVGFVLNVLEAVVFQYLLTAVVGRFRGGIKDLEVMMQNVITSAFETVTTVEQGVEVLDVFMHLSSREVSHKTLY